ncbi:CPBP family intramembrane glutamic endopeptidase [Thermoflavimicrobium dichotomicum]|uniref:CAAX prenyl protease 2/Lysostaphin resistance protein A-like domain-containing protein n=1 Tax=Thermoflavimicrobium dichotomicum TaxID=46223 RepID=A0A1I3M0A4_9BACL|nr:type II CAAX endopeptidase family protein [Thermoflavimicrobium dichotomicum]SFI90106.1 hypothetical protein SAMN05421852_102385 [Thermoflavimicrobium dichotomicum]
MQKALEMVLKTIGLYGLFLFLAVVPIFFVPNMDLFVIQEIAMIVSVLIFYYGFEKQKGWTLGLKQPKCFLLFLMGALFGIILMAIAFGLIVILGGVEITGIEWNPEIGRAIVYWLFLFFLVALAEEIFARGYLFGLVKYLYAPKKVAVIVSAVVFALLHSFNANVWSNVIPMLELFFAGVLFAMLRQVSGGLWMPIGLHLTWNFFQGPIFGFEVSGLEVPSLFHIKKVGHPLISGGAFGVEGSVISIVLSLLSIWGIYLYGRKKID